MENQNENPEKPHKQTEEEAIKEVGSNLTGTARPATADEKELLAHHGKKAEHYPTVENTDALIANVDPKPDQDKNKQD